PPLKFDPKEARERLKKGGYKGEEIVIETTVGYTANDKAMSEAIQGMWRDVGVNAKVEQMEYSVRAQKLRDKSFKGLWWSDPTSPLSDPDGMFWRLLGPAGPKITGGIRASISSATPRGSRWTRSSGPRPTRR